MKKLTLDLESLTVETFAAGEREAAELASTTRWCTVLDTCTNCNNSACIC